MRHFTCSNIEESWLEGWGRFLRLRYLLSLTSLESVLAALSFLKLQLPYAVMVVVICIVILVAMILIRFYRIRISKLNSTFHNYTHTMRDQVASTLKATVEGGYKYAFQEFNASTAENIAVFFRNLIGGGCGITCAVRLAYYSEGKEHYITVGRSSGFDLTRKDSSEPIPSNEGVARILRQKNALGVLIVNNIADAIKRNVWFETKNDALPDVQSVMVAPINGYADGQKSMIGLLYIGATKNVFSQFHVDIVRGFADYLGTTYPTVTGHIERECANV